MKTMNHHVYIAKLAVVATFFTASGCGLLLDGYGDEPSSGMGGNAGSGVSSSASSGAGGMEGPGAGGAGVSSGSAVSSASSASSASSSSSGSGDICNATELKVELTEPELVLPRSTIGKNGSFLAPKLSTRCIQPTSGPEDVYVVNVASDGVLTTMLNASTTKFDSVLYARKGNCVAGVVEHCADRTSAAHDLNGGEVLSFPVKAGETWYVIVDGYKDAADGKGDYTLRASLRTGANMNSIVPIRFELGSTMTLDGVIDTENDIWTLSCGGEGEIIYKVEYGTGVKKLKLSAIPGAIDTDLALYGTKELPDGYVSEEGSCETAGCGNTPHLDLFAGTTYMVVDGSLPGGSTCVDEDPGPYKLIVEPSATP